MLNAQSKMALILLTRVLSVIMLSKTNSKDSVPEMRGGLLVESRMLTKILISAPRLVLVRTMTNSNSTLLVLSVW